MVDNHTNSWSQTVNDPPVSSGVAFTYTVPTAPTWIAPAPITTNYTYTVSTITDNSGCGAGTTSGSASVEVYPLPRTGPQYHIPNSFGL
jgi:hypothetical protein